MCKLSFDDVFGSDVEEESRCKRGRGNEKSPFWHANDARVRGCVVGRQLEDSELAVRLRREAADWDPVAEYDRELLEMQRYGLDSDDSDSSVEDLSPLCPCQCSCCVLELE